MSTVRDNVTQARFSELARAGLALAHTGDLASLWKISDRNLLYTTVSRYCRAGLLRRVYRGFYAIRDLEKIDPWLLGASALHRYAYVSTETILAREGVIMQDVPHVTYVSSVSKRFVVGEHCFISRRLAPRFLAAEAGVCLAGGVFVATLERAVADLRYFNPKVYFDRPQVVDWDRVRDIEREIGYPLKAPLS